MAYRVRPVRTEPGRGDPLGHRTRSGRHRGRLRRRVPLRPDTGRRAAGPGARPRGLRRLGEQDARAGDPARMVRPAAAPDRADGRREDRGRPRLARARAGRAGGLRRARRVRPAPAADASHLPQAARRAAGRIGPAPALAPAGRRFRRAAPGHLAASAPGRGGGGRRGPAGRSGPGRGRAVPHHEPGSGGPDLRLRDGQRAGHRRGRGPAGAGYRRALTAAVSISACAVRVGGDRQITDREAGMGRIVVMNHVTLDGVMQGPGRADEDTRDGFTQGGWASRSVTPDDATGKTMGERMAAGGGLAGWLFGRRTYEDLLASWNARGGPFKDALNNSPKYVASATLSEPLPWPNSTLLHGDIADAVGALKAQSGGVLAIM